MKQIAARLRKQWVLQKLRRFLDREPIRFMRLGTENGGWVVPERVADAGGIAVCVGAGEDISFDVELNKRGFHVYTLDPTPRAKKHVEQVLEAARSGSLMAINHSSSDQYDLSGFDGNRFRFLDVGFWEEDTTMRFFSPREASHVSHSIVNLQKTEEYFEARCVTMSTLSALLNLREFTLLKIDVEGAEYAVLRNLIAQGPLPEVLCVEFDELLNPIDTNHPARISDAIGMLKDSGYKFVHLDRCNALFLLSRPAIRTLGREGASIWDFMQSGIVCA
jgi:FkbM family methyltransferase